MKLLAIALVSTLAGPAADRGGARPGRPRRGDDGQHRRRGARRDPGRACARGRPTTTSARESRSGATARSFQILHTTYRLTYRNFYYEDKGMLRAASPRALGDRARSRWRAAPDDPGARRGHDRLPARDDDPQRPRLARAGRARLRKVGGVWKEPFNFPLDPEFLFQRTGYACMDEEGYPLRHRRVGERLAALRQDCEVETPEEPFCHMTEFPDETCRRPCGATPAASTRTCASSASPGTPARPTRSASAKYAHDDGPDLEVIGDGLLNNRIVWRYIEPDSCAIEEQCVGGPGWRRLLEFDASVRNVSRPAAHRRRGGAGRALRRAQQLHPERLPRALSTSATTATSATAACPGDKRAFCIESTDRYFNSEDTPLVHPYTCDFQGIASGWGDTYIAGIECNWIDITDLDIPAGGVGKDLRFQPEPRRFICEGTPGPRRGRQPDLRPDRHRRRERVPVDRPRCDVRRRTTRTNNFQKRQVTRAPRRRLHHRALHPQPGGPAARLRLDGAGREPHLRRRGNRHPELRDGTAAPLQALRICEESRERAASSPACSARRWPPRSSGAAPVRGELHLPRRASAERAGRDLRLVHRGGPPRRIRPVTCRAVP